MSNKSLIGNLKTVVVGGESANPHYAPEHAGKEGNPKAIAVSYNAMESPAALWFHKVKCIDEHHFRAAANFRKIYEGAGGAGAGGMDYSAVRVDTSSKSDPINGYQLDCHMHLKVAENHIGAHKYKLIRDTCGNGTFVRDMSKTRRGRDKIMNEIRAGLTELSALWGYTTSENRTRDKPVHPFHR